MFKDMKPTLDPAVLGEALPVSAPPLGAVRTCSLWEPFALCCVGDPRFFRGSLRKGTEEVRCPPRGPDVVLAGGSLLPTLISPSSSSEISQPGAWVLFIGIAQAIHRLLPCVINLILVLNYLHPHTSILSHSFQGMFSHHAQWLVLPGPACPFLDAGFSSPPEL